MGDKKHDPYPNFPISGQLEGLVSGTVYGFPDEECTRVLLIAHPDNSGTAWVGNVTGTVGNADGYPLSALGPAMPMEGLRNLELLVANFDVANDRICWILQRSEQRTQ